MNKLKANPNAWFEDSGEVDYISYLEEDTSLVEKDKLFIVYSGSNSAKDWVANFTIGHTMGTGLCVHEGIGKLFEKSIDYQYSSSLSRLEKYYTYHRKPKKLEINILGHSLGGGLGSLAAYQYREALQDHLQEITGLDQGGILVKAFLFGSPAIIDRTSQEAIEAALGRNNIFRIWTFDDPVVNWTENSTLQLGRHIGRSFPLYNIENHPINFLDTFWGPHGASHYYSYLHKLVVRKPPQQHKMLLEALQGYLDSLFIQEPIKHYKKLEITNQKEDEQGEADRQYQLGEEYKKMNDNQKAVEHYKKAAEKEHILAQYKLGDMYAQSHTKYCCPNKHKYYGHGIKQNYKEAVKWYQKAAENGHQPLKDRLFLYFS